MPNIQTITITPNLPPTLAPLLEIAKNLWWTWNIDAIYLFQDMDRELWNRTGHNPIAMLGMIEQAKIEELARDDFFLTRMQEVYQELQRYLSSQTWFKNRIDTANASIKGYFSYEPSLSDDYTMSGSKIKNVIAYFSAEFGIHESLPLYSGGLGILAGDHIKSSSDLGLPLVGVGLLYKHGYFRQYLNPDGWQMETYPKNDFYNMPISRILNEKGEPLLVEIELDNRSVFVQAWSMLVGRVEIIMLDTDVPQNAPNDRKITSYLYGGGLETRLQQEIVLGMGGIQMLNAIGKCPTVCHMNEGHSAFSALERLACLREREKLSFEEALEAVRITSVFTTHTPVPAGIDRFPSDLIRRYFAKMATRLGIDMDTLLGMGRIHPTDPNEDFCMAVLAIKTASQINGVSKLHGEVSRRMWASIWPNIPSHETPITHITNGIHTLGWLSSEMARLYQRYLGYRWIDEPANHSIWKRVDNIPAFEIWRARERRVETLISFARSRLKQQLMAKGASGLSIKMADEVLDPEALTIGFARRFATYKRATLIFRNPERLAKILTNPERPVQLIISGKAHPQDKYGKELIHKIMQFVNMPEFRNHVVFIEDYDIEVARHLVQGVDVWLNTPLRPNEASGTSGMKVTANGGLNLSILDGWWVEGYKGNNGWAIGAGEEYTDPQMQDEIESNLLYELLENSVVPTFYNRSHNNIPYEWIEMIKNSIKTICPFFNTNRMVEEYAKNFYLPNAERSNILSKNNWEELKKICSWKRHIIEEWAKVRIVEVHGPNNSITKVGDRVPIHAKVDLASLTPDDVRVEAYIGRPGERDEVENGQPLPLLPTGEHQGSIYHFMGNILCLSSGQIGYTVRCYPYRKEFNYKFEMGLLTWW